MRELALRLPSFPRTLLVDTVDAGRWLGDDRLVEVAGFATGMGPAKRLLMERPQIVAAAPYAFTTSAASAVLSRFADVGDEMRYYLTQLEVDALFTDNPDRFPR